MFPGITSSSELRAVTVRILGIPPDPDGSNEARSNTANVALLRFCTATDTDHEDALADMLCNIMHWCDRTGWNFKDELRRAVRNYRSEISRD